MENIQEKVSLVIEQMNNIILGKEEQIKEIFLTVIAGGHVLLEDIPGTGKTTLSSSLAKVLGLEMNRVQFTPDVMPSDLTGFSIYNKTQEKFVYQEGALFCNLLLADELNRTSPKTQSALLEAMSENKITVEGKTRDLPEPFFVIATQNPIGSIGTQQLPESQLDRFMTSLSLGYPDFTHELSMIMSEQEEKDKFLQEQLISKEEILQIQSEVRNIYIKENVGKYLLNLVMGTRQHSDIELGLSPRATKALLQMAKASAWIAGRNYVVPKDVSTQFLFVARHRIILNHSAYMNQVNIEDVVKEILKGVSEPPLGEECR